MPLPIRTTLTDVDVVCRYLATKPTGATSAESRAVVDRKHLDGRKLAALNYWGLIEDAGNKMKLTDRGRRVVKDGGAARTEVMLEIVREVPPYLAVVERAAHRCEDTLSATEVAAHWHEHFRNEGSDSDTTLTAQAVCFFHVAEGADLGKQVVGRRGQPTRFEFDVDRLQVFSNGSAESVDSRNRDSSGFENEPDDPIATPETNDSDVNEELGGAPVGRNCVFITHGSNSKILEQVKELVAYGRFEPVVAKEHETAAKPVPQKVIDDMKTCRAAVIHVGAEGVLYDEAGVEVPQINGNVLIEIGAAMALYGSEFILLVQQGVNLPSNLQGLYECRYEGEELNMAAIMKLLKALSGFGK